MMITKISSTSDSLDAVLEGAKILYDAVSTTMGPRGSNVIFRKYGKRVGVTHDGVTVAKMVKIDDEMQDVGADLLREAAMKMDATTGDGTTTVTVLSYHILKEAVEAIKAGANPMKLKLAIDALQPEILAQIDKHTDKDITEKKLIDVASVASGSKEIGKEVGEVVFKAGKDTPILLGFSDNTETRAEVIKGFKIDAGPASPYLMQGIVKTEIASPKILVADAKLRDKEDVLPLLKLIAQLPEDQRRVLLVCSDIAGDALSYMVVNHLKGFAQIAVVRVPAHINAQSEYLADVATSCGATLMSKNTGASIMEPEISYFGSAKRVTVEPNETIIAEGEPIKEDMDARIASLKDLQKNGKTIVARKFADDRLKTLEQKVVSIYVGGQSETDAEERHYRYEDAVGASRAALRGGIVPGGGTLLASIAETIGGVSLEGDLVARALVKPMTKVLSNAGIINELDEGIAGVKVGHGYDVMNPDDGVIDLVERGIVDPAESEIECIKTAIAIAGLLMTTGAMVVDQGEPDATQFPQSTYPS